MGRSLKYEIHGTDWRRSVLDLVECGVGGLFASEMEEPKEVTLEIGFGRGEFLLELARLSPSTAYLGVEVSYKRVLKMARKVAQARLRNVRLLEGRAEVLVGQLIEPATLSDVWINFSDPWPKDRHAGRRLIQPPLVADVVRCLIPGGVLHVATDDGLYAEQIDRVLSSESRLENAFAPARWLNDVPGRIRTGYEVDWREQGRSLYFFDYRRWPESALGDPC